MQANLGPFPTAVPCQPRLLAGSDHLPSVPGIPVRDDHRPPSPRLNPAFLAKTGISPEIPRKQPPNLVPVPVRTHQRNMRWKEWLGRGEGPDRRRRYRLRPCAFRPCKGNGRRVDGREASQRGRGGVGGAKVSVTCGTGVFCRRRYFVPFVAPLPAVSSLL